MKIIIHKLSALMATFCITLFFSATVVSEVLGNYENIAIVKKLILFPGLFILIPFIVATGISGSIMTKSKKGIVTKKKKRMILITFNGIFILIPCAIVLNYLASRMFFNQTFYIIQIIELLAGLINIILMILNIKDGIKIYRLKNNK